MTIQRVRVVMNNWPGAPGYINFYENSDVVSHEPYRVFFDAIKALVPIGLTFQVPGIGDILSEETGNIIGSYSFTTPALVTGTGNATYPNGVGACVDWLTAGVVAGRRVMGRTFLVPLTNVAYDTNGTLTPTALTTLQNAALALSTALGADFVIWSRPFEGGPGGVPAARAGSVHAVVSAKVPDLAAQLRSRRT